MYWKIAATSLVQVSPEKKEKHSYEDTNYVYAQTARNH